MDFTIHFYLGHLGHRVITKLFFHFPFNTDLKQI